MSTKIIYKTWQNPGWNGVILKKYFDGKKHDNKVVFEHSNGWREKSLIKEDMSQTYS